MRFLLSTCLLIPTLALGQDAPADGASPPAPCSSAEHRQFDFWVGEWDVTANGQPAGHNRIEAIHGGCALAEHWTSAAGGFAGSSLNIYDAAKGHWHQTWVDTGGTRLDLNGGFSDGVMVLSGQRTGADGKPFTDRITWTPNADGSVRQHWEVSNDGASWTTVFDGLYRRAGEAE